MGVRHTYRSIKYGLETLAPGLILERHRHEEGYATVVLDGALVEASFSGRAMARAGDVLLHGSFDCHANWTELRPLTILRLPWRDDDLEGHFRIRDADVLARIAERDPFEASLALRESLEGSLECDLDWPERLAVALSADPSMSLGAWARDHGLVPATISRGFRQAFGVTPRLFRLEVRARRAWNAVVRSNLKLTTIAHDFDFSDLAHMSRTISTFTGCTPSAWRRLRRARPQSAEAANRAR